MKKKKIIQATVLFLCDLMVSGFILVLWRMRIISIEVAFLSLFIAMIGSIRILEKLVLRPIRPIKVKRSFSPLN